MKRCNGILAALLVMMLVASSCSTVSPPVIEEEEVEQEEEDGLHEWWELQDMDLYRPWRSMDESMNPFKK